MRSSRENINQDPTPTYKSSEVSGEEWIEIVGIESAGFLNYFKNHTPDTERIWRELHEVTPGNGYSAVDLLCQVAELSHGEFSYGTTHITRLKDFGGDKLAIYDAPRSLRRDTPEETIISISGALYSTTIPVDPESKLPIRCSNGHSDAVKKDGTLELAINDPYELARGKNQMCMNAAVELSREINKAFQAVNEAYNPDHVDSYTL